MISSRSKKAEQMENQLRHFWRTSSRNEELARQTAWTDEMDDVRDELDTLAELTEWPALRRATRESLERDAMRRAEVKRDVA